jgi:alcohol dehydrogenase class IV
VAEDFTWRDGERLIRFGEGAAGQAPGLLEQLGFSPYTLLTTPRAEAAELVERAATVVHVPAGRVDEIAAALLPQAPDGPVVALGGGRVVDTAKAIAGASGARCAAVPTTLSGAEMTGFHRLPAGVDGARMVRPALVVADPVLMASAPPELLASTAMNALAHALEALYTPLANPVTSMAALRAAEQLARGLTADPPGRAELALGAVLAGYASGSTGIAVHHAVCQTLVRSAGTPHAETNAVMLPHSARFMAWRAPEAVAAFEAAVGNLDALAARSGHTRLASLGVREEQLPAVAATVLEHPLLGNTPRPPGEAELVSLLRAAL